MTKKTSQCRVTRGEVDLTTYSALDGEFRAIGIAAPARRALIDAGITRLSQLKNFTRQEIAALHGMGPSALRTLEVALKGNGTSFKSK